MTANTVTTAIYPRLSEAILLREQGETDRAAQLVMAHLRERPDEPRGLAQLGLIAAQTGALGQAEHFLRRALTLGEKNPELLRTLASVYSQQERLQVAESFTRRLIEEEGDLQLRPLRASLLDRMGRHDEAMAIQKQLVEEDPRSIPHLLAWGYNLRAAGEVAAAPVRWSPSQTRALLAEGLTASVVPQICSDGMSDRLYGLRASVILTGDQPRLLQGCCTVQP